MHGMPLDALIEYVCCMLVESFPPAQITQAAEDGCIFDTAQVGRCVRDAREMRARCVRDACEMRERYREMSGDVGRCWETLACLVRDAGLGDLGLG